MKTIRKNRVSDGLKSNNADAVAGFAPSLGHSVTVMSSLSFLVDPYADTLELPISGEPGDRS